MSRIYVLSTATHWFPLLHLNLLHQTCVSAPLLSLGLWPQVSLSPSPFFPPPSTPTLSLQDSSGLRLWKRRWFVLSGHCLFYYKGQCPSWHGVGGPPSHPPFPLASWPLDPCVTLDPSLSFADSREESVLGSVLLPSYSIRPDGPGAPRGRRFTFTVSASNPHGH